MLGDCAIDYQLASQKAVMRAGWSANLALVGLVHCHVARPAHREVVHRLVRVVGRVKGPVECPVPADRAVAPCGLSARAVDHAVLAEVEGA